LSRRRRDLSGPLSKKERIEAAKKRGRRFSLMVLAGVLVLVIAAGGIFLGPSIRKSFEPEAQANITREQAMGFCMQHGGVKLHIHPELRIIIDGSLVTIPEGVGILSNCMKPIHTHDPSGTLHIESAYRDYPYTLGDFFEVWGQPFNSGQILSCKADPTQRITMTVNGVPNNEYEKYVMRDGDKIVIRCASVK